MYMVEGNLFLNSFAFILFVAISSYTLVRSMVDVESFERKRYEKLRERGITQDIGRMAILGFLVSGVFLVAGINAEYKWVWRVFSAILFIIGVICFFVYSFKKITKSSDIKLPILLDEILAKNIRKRKIAWFFQSLIIVFWIYSWKALFV